jgi:hypothetical protein
MDHRVKPGGDESRSVSQRRNPADVVEVAERNGVSRFANPPHGTTVVKSASIMLATAP